MNYIRLIFSVTILCFVLPLEAQTVLPVKRDLLVLLDLVDNGPSGGSEAKLACECGGICCTDRLFPQLKAELKTINDARMNNNAINTASINDMAAKYQDPAYQAKLRTMSTEELMKEAQNISKGTDQALGRTRKKSGMPSSIEKAISDEFLKLTSSASDFNKQVSDMVTKAVLPLKVEEKKDEEAITLEYSKMCDGEVSADKLAYCNQICRQCHDLRLTSYKRELVTCMDAYGTLTVKIKSMLKARYSKFEALVRDSQYGNLVELQSAYDNLVAGQGYILSDLNFAFQTVSDAYYEVVRLQLKVDGASGPDCQ